MRGFEDFAKSFLVRQALKGYRKGTWWPDKRRPVSFNLLGLIFCQLRVVCSSPYEVVLFREAYSMEFCGACQISELVARYRSMVKGLLRTDVEASVVNVPVTAVKKGCV